ncbi:MAG: lactate utilization protein [Theionarchaea archaeon]|nr:lactate utilization protein [Theionarchaea archaeon]
MSDPEYLDKTVKALARNEFEVIMAKDGTDAVSILCDLIDTTAVVGIGDSATLRQLGILDRLHERGTSIINPFIGAYRRETAITCLLAHVFLTGANAITQDGKIVDIDGAGNRIAGTIYGPEKVIIVVGKNKIVPTVEDAFSRIKNYIAPYHAKTMGYNPPCTKTGKCMDCHSPDKVCRIETVIARNPMYSQIYIIMVNEDLGLSWDPEWSTERIQNIQKAYENHVWAYGK